MCDLYLILCACCLWPWLGPWNHVLDGAQILQGEGEIFRGCPGHKKALAIFAAPVAAALLQKGSFSRNNVMHQKGSFSMSFIRSFFVGRGPAYSGPQH